MGLLRHTIIFIQIVWKGCMESPAVRSVLIFLSIIAALTFIPYWVGLLVIDVFPPPVWAGGFLCLLLAGFIISIFVGAYVMIYEVVRAKMRKQEYEVVKKARMRKQK